MQLIRPYISDDLDGIDLDVPDVRTIDAERTFWNRVVILHGLPNWFETRGELKQDGQRISRHFYDLHCMLWAETGRAAVAVRHARSSAFDPWRNYADKMTA